MSSAAPTELIVLAGGKGTRLKSVTGDVPKPLVPIQGRPFLEHQLEYWMKQGIRRAVLALGYRAELFEQHFGPRFGELELAYSVEREPLGTGGALAMAAAELRADGCFAVCNGDTFIDLDLGEMARMHERAGAVMSMALAGVAQNTRYGEVELDGGRVVGFREKSGSAGRAYVNAGFYLIERSAFSGLSERGAFSWETAVMPRLVRENIVQGFTGVRRFLDIGIPEDFARAGEFLAGGR